VRNPLLIRVALLSISVYIVCEREIDAPSDHKMRDSLYSIFQGKKYCMSYGP
jgi:hypothetical protein